MFYLWVLLATASCASASDLKAAPVSSALPASDSPQLSTPTPASSAIPNPTLAPTESNHASNVVIDPLTGLPPADPSLLQRRPLAVKISLFPRDVPMYGLSLVDVAFEYFSFPGETRFIGVFYGNNAKQVGAVRSGRYFDENLVRMYHAYLVYNNADPREQQYFYSGDLRKFLVVPGPENADCPPFLIFRYSTDVFDIGHYEQYFDTTKFSDCLAQKNADNSSQVLRPSSFSKQPLSTGALAANRIFVNYFLEDYNYWQYDPSSSRYLRFQEATENGDPNKTYIPLMDKLTNQQVTADNVVILFVSHTFLNENEQEDSVYHINLIDAGNAYVFRNGLVVPAYWVRTDINQPLLITDLHGSPIPMKAGQTFFEVVGETSDHKSDGADWYFDYNTP
jgi:hypothetical protein